MKALKSIMMVGLIGLSINFISCDANGDFVLFSVQNDIELGASMHQQITSDPTQFPILSKTAYPEAYGYLEDMVDEILNNADITYRNDFQWEVSIIDQNVLNAFVTPGGYIYVYNGLIQHLDSADHLAGVLGHEIAHADQRHSSKAMQREFGIQVLLSVILGEDASTLETAVAQIAGTIGGLAFSRGAESEADEFSVEYLANTKYACDGTAGFFEKLSDGQSGGDFLSTHPDPDNRVADITAKAGELGCSTDGFADAPSAGCGGDTEYECFKLDWLPDLQ